MAPYSPRGLEGTGTHQKSLPALTHRSMVPQTSSRPSQSIPVPPPHLLPEVVIYEFYFVFIKVSISRQIDKEVTFFSNVFIQLINQIIKQSKNLFIIFYSKFLFPLNQLLLFM